jgi:hypothetical protein
MTKGRETIAVHGSGFMVIDQETRWLNRYNEVMRFLEENHRNPSKYVAEDRDMLNWLKATRKRMNAGTLKPKRVVLFKKLLELGEQYRRKNQYE